MFQEKNKNANQNMLFTSAYSVCFLNILIYFFPRLFMGFVLA